MSEDDSWPSKSRAVVQNVDHLTYAISLDFLMIVGSFLPLKVGMTKLARTISKDECDAS